MFSLSWPRWIAKRFPKKSRCQRRSERPRLTPSLERLETRELLTTAAPVSIAGQAAETATPASDVAPLFGPPSSGYSPSQISQAYGFNQISFANGTVKGNGSGQTIAIVDAYNDPNITNDLYEFDQHFGLANPNFTVVNQTGGMVLPEVDPTGDWEVEESLDVEWAHAMAPGANIVLVEANSDNISDLLASVQTAASLPGVSVVSMSWGDSEFYSETSYDSYFTTPAGHNGVTFVAASGDSGAPPIYPAVSPNVLAVGGTTLSLDAEGDYLGETAWSGSGGGISAYEAQPAYQKGVVSQSTTQRTSPDVAYDADPETGFAVYDSYGVSGETGPWYTIGGTSAGAPQWAALIAIADQGRALMGEGSLDGASQTLPMIYQMPASNFHDITSGSSTGSPAYSAGPGYDLATGRGSPNANLVVNYLVNGTSPPTSPAPSPSPSPSPSPPSGNLVSDGNFEYPSVGPTQAIDPVGSPWSFEGQAGIAGIGSDLTSGDPAGLQFGFLVGQGGGILQLVDLAAGNYTLSFQAAQVGMLPGSQEQIEVFVGSMVVALVKPGPSLTSYTANFPIASAGTYALQFVGIAPGSSNAALVDNIFLQSTTSTLAPVPSPGSSPSPSPGSSPSPSHSPPPAPPSPPPSSAAAGDQSSSSGAQLTQNDMDALLQTMISTISNLLLSELLLMQSEINQFLQMSSAMTGIPLSPNLINSLDQALLGPFVEQWAWLDPQLSEYVP